ncbi:uncharacterized protein LOC113147253 [Cyclospora cayetanensis]|uniref:Uncharacterized protein LOC113147253 n=1 Tax=Cyclospora cayetanensis TaxID=88456 RepID=A0A6P6S020_9EIME|nr:uncharacterized protein LOC113147253 [Cyclospora cayetanensis]
MLLEPLPPRMYRRKYNEKCACSGRQLHEAVQLLREAVQSIASVHGESSPWCNSAAAASSTAALGVATAEACGRQQQEDLQLRVQEGCDVDTLALPQTEWGGRRCASAAAAAFAETLEGVREVLPDARQTAETAVTAGANGSAVEAPPLPPHRNAFTASDAWQKTMAAGFQHLRSDAACLSVAAQGASSWGPALRTGRIAAAAGAAIPVPAAAAGAAIPVPQQQQMQQMQQQQTQQMQQQQTQQMQQHQTQQQMQQMQQMQMQHQTLHESFHSSNLRVQRLSLQPAQLQQCDRRPMGEGDLATSAAAQQGAEAAAAASCASSTTFCKPYAADQDDIGFAGAAISPGDAASPILLPAADALCLSAVCTFSGGEGLTSAAAAVKHFEVPRLDSPLPMAFQQNCELHTVSRIGLLVRHRGDCEGFKCRWSANGGEKDEGRKRGEESGEEKGEEDCSCDCAHQTARKLPKNWCVCGRKGVAALSFHCTLPVQVAFSLPVVSVFRCRENMPASRESAREGCLPFLRFSLLANPLERLPILCAAGVCQRLAAFGAYLDTRSCNSRRRPTFRRLGQEALRATARTTVAAGCSAARGYVHFALRRGVGRSIAFLRPFDVAPPTVYVASTVNDAMKGFPNKFKKKDAQDLGPDAAYQLGNGLVDISSCAAACVECGLEAAAYVEPSLAASWGGYIFLRGGEERVFRFFPMICGLYLDEFVACRCCASLLHGRCLPRSLCGASEAFLCGRCLTLSQ